MNGGRALGLGLMLLGGVLGALVLVWLVVNAAGGQLQAGGFVFGVIILAVLALPPIGAGYYLLRRSAVEQAEQARFERRRQVLDADQIFRTAIARDLKQLQRRLDEAPDRGPTLVRASSRVRDLIDDVEQVGYDQASWHDAVQLEDEDIDALRQYDDVLSSSLRRLSSDADAAIDGQGAAHGGLIAAIQQWDDTLAQRQDLLLRGKRAAAAAPGELLRARTATRTADITALRPKDAVSYQGDDFLVEVSVTYFSGGKTWWLHRIRGGADERWLYVAPEGLSSAVLQTIDPPGDPRSEMIRYKGSACRPTDSGEASATIDSADGKQEGIAVQYWRFACPDGSILTVEHWPDEQRAYVGKTTKAGDLEVFQAAQS